MMRTDYGHHDHAAAGPGIGRSPTCRDLEGWRNLTTAGGINARVYDKIVDANPRSACAL